MRSARYDSMMATKRMTMMLDTDLVDRAARLLGTRRPTDTVRAALERTVREEHIGNLVAWELPDEAAVELEDRRRPRGTAD